MTYGEKIEKIKAEAAVMGARLLPNEALSKHTTVRVGGKCGLMVAARDAESAARLYFECKKIGLYCMILGNGSNCLFSDEGFHGAVIVPGAEQEKIAADGDTLYAPAGANLSAVCGFALKEGLTGLEFAYGIPGTVGGAVYMNAGAYGGEIKNVVESVTAMNADSEIVKLSPDELDLGYRSSRFEKTGEVILSASFKLSKGDRDEIHGKMEELMARRKSRQPLEYPSFGSAFKRPEGTYAGLVIEQSGLKGYRLGGAQISPKHANFIVNLGGATAKDITELITYAQSEVKDKTGYFLEPEVRLIPPDM